MRRSTLVTTVAAVTLVAGLVPSPAAQAGRGRPVAGRFRHLVVIYQENHSFDNLFGLWGRAGGERVDGLRPGRAAPQVTQAGEPYRCLLQDDVNLTSPTPLPATCADPEHGVLASAFVNAPFRIDDHIGPDDRTCPPPGVSAPNGVPKDSAGAEPGGCTRDLVHRFYQEQYQIDGGRQDRYVTGSDAVGLTMGYYDTTRLPLYAYLHQPGAPRYVVADRFFQAAFGGSFLNHQYLIAARAPVDVNGSTTDAGLHSVVDAAGFPNASYPLYHPATAVKDAQLTQACGPAAHPGLACGDYAVNTMQPASAPHGSGAQLPLIDDAAYPNIGDRLSAAGVPWAWYSGGWDDAEAGHPGPLFQYHHQPFNYFAGYAPGQPGRAHLRDETAFFAAARAGTLPVVSFVKPYGAENEHPGYASEPDGSDHLVELLKAVQSGPQARDTLVVVTYDEFGGSWDHVPPPGAGGPTRGAHDRFGPGTRVPALLVAAGLRRSGVDHTVYDTTSILATIERGLGLPPLDTRDARVNDLSHALAGRL
ncbi:alkaline phosphatase family protein [Actinomadura sp. ATCC 31491]|uniref:Alkaline phosphatase family protein n=1 Tax=Actinomadura luzonensis TaxID=2805427 RepID=A0ABT0G6Y1_9ACTN|nr:alkaline phosphatase family protein [Actinomadura luzonensis]MCK2220358.1 alkaline phosphatase family protein [Actinomadura luzonensis]